MPKKLFAVTNVKIGSGPGESFEAGSEIDASKFTKAQILELHDAGAVEVRVVEEEAPAEETAETAPDASATETGPEGSSQEDNS